MACRNHNFLPDSNHNSWICSRSLILQALALYLVVRAFERKTMKKMKCAITLQVFALLLTPLAFIFTFTFFFFTDREGPLGAPYVYFIVFYFPAGAFALASLVALILLYKKQKKRYREDKKENQLKDEEKEMENQLKDKEIQGFPVDSKESNVSSSLSDHQFKDSFERYVALMEDIETNKTEKKTMRSSQ